MGLNQQQLEQRMQKVLSFRHTKNKVKHLISICEHAQQGRESCIQICEIKDGQAIAGLINLYASASIETSIQVSLSGLVTCLQKNLASKNIAGLRVIEAQEPSIRGSLSEVRACVNLPAGAVPVIISDDAQPIDLSALENQRVEEAIFFHCDGEGYCQQLELASQVVSTVKVIEEISRINYALNKLEMINDCLQTVSWEDVSGSSQLDETELSDLEEELLDVMDVFNQDFNMQGDLILTDEAQREIKTKIVGFMTGACDIRFYEQQFTQFFTRILFPVLQQVEEVYQKEIVETLLNQSDELQFSVSVKKIVLYEFMASVLRHAFMHNKVFSLLKLLSEYNAILDYVILDHRIDAVIAEAINSQMVSRSSPDIYFQPYAKIMNSIFVNDQERFVALLNQVSFSEQNGYSLPGVIYDTFIKEHQPEQPMYEEHGKKFLRALVHAFCIAYFRMPELNNKYAERTQQLLDIYFTSPRINRLVSNLIEQAKRESNTTLEPSSFFSIPFLLFSLSGWNTLEDNLTWCRMMYWLGMKSNNKEEIRQGALIIINGGRVEGLVKTIELLSSLRHYFMSEDSLAHSQELYKFIAEKLVLAVKLLDGLGLVLFLKRVQELFLPVLDVDKEQLKKILNVKAKVGGYTNGLAAVLATYASCFEAEDTAKWVVHELPDKVLFLYSYIAYPLEEYKRWLIDANPAHSTYIENNFSELEAIKEKLTGLSDLSALGFKLVQNNQLAALVCATHPIEDSKSLFFRVGTGQGKSLIAALTALHYALAKKKVLIVTCYDHLAERDYNKFSPLFSGRQIQSQLVTLKGNAGNAQIIYAELQTYFNALRAQIQRKAEGQYSSEDGFNFFDADVLILDEVDSLIDDAQEFGNTVHDYHSTLNLPSITADDFEQPENLRTKLSRRPEYAELFNRLEHNGLISLYEQWFAKVKHETQRGRQAHNNLGIECSYIGGSRFELENGKCYVNSIYLSVLSFLSAAAYERVIGFSGTISRASSQRYQKLYPESHFFHIPPFYGKVSKNSFITDTRSQPLNESYWKEAIKTDVTKALERGQPVLVFADIDSTEEWREIKGILQNILAQAKRSLIIIDKEKGITVSLLQPACQPGAVTLASHVVGRGTDFVLPRDSVLRGGLHVLVTYVPGHENKTNSNLLEQMFGRGGRMGQEGSSSLVVKKTVSSATDTALLTVPDYEKNFHLLMKDAYLQIKNEQVTKVWKNWLLINLWMAKSTTFPPAFQEQNRVPAAFLVNCIIKDPIPVEVDELPVEQQDEEIREGEELLLQPEEARLNPSDDHLQPSRKALGLIKYANAIMTTMLILFYTLPEYAIPLTILENEQNDALLRDCAGLTENHFVLPYQDCSMSAMFEMNSNHSAHNILDRSVCLPSYLAGTAVYLGGYDYRMENNNATIFIKRASLLSIDEQAMQGCTNAYFAIFLLPLLFMLEKQSHENRQRYKNLTISCFDFFKNATLIFLQYFFIADAAVFGVINQFINKEKCPGLYSLDGSFGTAILITFMTLFGATFALTAFFLKEICALEDKNKLLEKIKLIALCSLTASGIAVFSYNLYQESDSFLLLPKLLFDFPLSFYNGAILKLISWALLLENFIATFDVYACPGYAVNNRFNFWHERNAPAENYLPDVELGERGVDVPGP